MIGADFVGTDGDVNSLSDVVKLALGLPWTKLASWSVAALAFYQLHDFFGVGARRIWRAVVLAVGWCFDDQVDS